MYVKSTRPSATIKSRALGRSNLRAKRAMRMCPRSAQIFFVGFTTQVLVITIEIVKPTKKIFVLTNKVAEAYFTNRSSWFS